VPTLSNNNLKIGKWQAIFSYRIFKPSRYEDEVNNVKIDLLESLSIGKDVLLSLRIHEGLRRQLDCAKKAF
jgi:hypothetical protein